MNDRIRGFGEQLFCTHAAREPQTTVFTLSHLPLWCGEKNSFAKPIICHVRLCNTFRQARSVEDRTQEPLVLRHNWERILIFTRAVSSQFKFLHLAVVVLGRTIQSRALWRAQDRGGFPGRANVAFSCPCLPIHVLPRCMLLGTWTSVPGPLACRARFSGAF